ncbi:DUF6316 family protein [Metapseudomonas boanensis]|uniref:DUF6316 domain-containing protein n=1 Tax=Metapseudomonas boanensis TaxID=2822138 RepID=A0ABS5XIH2_9GAMM|nr:DUF6316 family protein [Pseudomonas boanensis]MBT8767489.1 hypothetical protein [Pseudomonas boanensis]
MLAQRETDAAIGTHYRSERVSSVNGQYFFATREGTLEGPFFTRVDAELAVQRYIGRMHQAQAILTGRAR